MVPSAVLHTRNKAFWELSSALVKCVADHLEMTSDVFDRFTIQDKNHFSSFQTTRLHKIWEKGEEHIDKQKFIASINAYGWDLSAYRPRPFQLM